MTDSIAGYDVPIEIEYECKNCSGRLSARHVHVARGWGRIAGLEDLVYFHAATGEKRCPPHSDAEPYCGWAASRAFRKAMAESE